MCSARRPTRTAVIAALVLAATGCGDDQPSDRGATTTTSTTLNTTRATASDGSVVDLEQFIGLPLADAEARARQHGLRSRVVERDGQALEVTADYSDRRLGFSVVDDRVVAVSVG